MIRSFRDAGAQAIFNGMRSPKFQAVEKAAMRKLFQLHAATALHDLKSPGNQLEALSGDRKGQHSIRINDQYRVCFVWKDRDAYEVEITDYH